VIGLSLALVNKGVFLTTAIIQMGYGLLISLPDMNTTSPATFRVALWLPAIMSFAGLAAAAWVQETFPSR